MVPNLVFGVIEIILRLESRIYEVIISLNTFFFLFLHFIIQLIGYMTMEQARKDYYAFISYNSADEKWAKWLQHKLEYYHIPNILCKEYPNLPKKIRPVFWYKQDLSGTKLKQVLCNELNSSKYLIVICSPDSAKSVWVNDEIESFINQGKGDRIIPFIIAGTPHADNPEEECFPPALRTLSRDEEIRGIDIRRKEGKSHALVDVIATMFEVRFDVLWQRHERRRKKIRIIKIAVLALVALIALGIYDYKRSKVEYYADFVDCYGVAQGITPLTNAQVSRRYCSYKFEYLRIPFGEKGFYSWRLNRVSLVNSKGYVRDDKPDNHEFFYPIQEFKYSDGYATEIVNRDNLRRIVMRYTVKDDYDRNIACLIDMERKEKHQGDAFLASSTISTDSASTISKIKRFHYTRDNRGYITSITYHANDADELDESAISDNNNIFGKKFELDSLGRIVEVKYVGHEDEIISDKHGVAGIKYQYSKGNLVRKDYLGIDGHLVYNSQKYARCDMKYDEFGNKIETINYDPDKRACLDDQYICRAEREYDKSGFCTEIRCYNTENKLALNSFNWAIRKIGNDSKGRMIMLSHFGIDKKPCYDDSWVNTYKLKYNSQDCLTELASFDVNNNPCVDKSSGAYIVRYEFDSNNNLTGQLLYDADNELYLSPMGCAYVQIKYDSYSNIISRSFYDDKKRPILHKQGCHEIRYKYDNRGNMIETSNFDEKGSPCYSKDGFSSMRWKYDSFGNIIEEAYFGIEGELVYVNGVTKYKNGYTKNGLRNEIYSYGINDSLCLNPYWYAIEKLEYDINGNITKASYFDADTLPCYYKDGIYSVLERVYEGNDLVMERFYNKNMELQENSSNYAIAKFDYDNKHHITSYKYYDSKGNPCVRSELYHSQSVLYTANGQIAEYEYFDKRGNRCNSKDGYSKMQYKYDLKGMNTEITFYDKDGELRKKENNASKRTFEYDEYGRIVTVCNFDSNNKLTWVQEEGGDTGQFVCQIEYEYDALGNNSKIVFRDPDGRLTVRGGYAVCERRFDDLGRLIEAKYYDEKENLIGGNAYYPIEKYSYDRDFIRLSLYYNDTTLVTNINYYNRNGCPVKIAYTDDNGVPQIKSLLAVSVSEVPFAICIIEYDVKGNRVKQSFLNEKEQLYNNTAGFAYQTYGYDDKGQVVLMQHYDKDNQLVNYMPNGSSTIRRAYDIYGNLIEQSYYDKDGKLAHTPWGWSRRLQKFDETGMCISDVYYQYDGLSHGARKEKLLDGTMKSYRLENGRWESAEQMPVSELSAAEKTVIQLNIEGYGQMYEKGFRGQYIILTFNEWNCTEEGIDSFKDVLMRSKGQKKHLVLLPISDQLGDEEIVEYTFSEDALGARIMDFQDKDGKTRKITIAKYKEFKNGERRNKKVL